MQKYHSLTYLLRVRFTFTKVDDLLSIISN